MANDSEPRFGERAEPGPNDVCYRHPDTVSFTLCQRCSRTICPKCQISSPVGVLCPECVREMQPSRKQQLTRKTRVAGRKLAALDTPVTTIILIVNLAVFGLQLLGQYFLSNGVTTALWYAPVYSVPSGVHDVQGQMFGFSFEPWRMLTVTFTHSTGFLMHILFNMYALWLFGRNIEQILGRAKFLALYLLSGLGGSVAVMLWAYVDPNSLLVPTVGASGAIFGLLGATVVALRTAQVSTRTLLVMIAINLAIGFIPGASISWQAHLGGIIVGTVTMWLLSKNRGPRQRAGRTASLVGVGAVLVALSFAYFVALPF